MFSLSGQKVVVIGGSYGIGLAIAEMAIEAGANVAIAARDKAKLEAAARSLEALGNGDIARTALEIENRQAVREFLAASAPIDHLVLPGSSVKPRTFDDLSEQDARQSFDSKFWGPFFAAYDARAFLRRGGSVVFFSGISATRPVRRYVIGACIDGAVNAATRSLAVEFAALGVRVNTIAPGLIETPLLDITHHSDREQFDAQAKRLPVGRYGVPRDCAMGAIYLMTDGFVTAQVLGIDGGQEVMI